LLKKSAKKLRASHRAPKETSYSRRLVRLTPLPISTTGAIHRDYNPQGNAVLALELAAWSRILVEHAEILFQRPQRDHRIDDIGEELADETAAWNEATLVAGELFKDIDGKFQPRQEWSLQVTDEQRYPIYLIAISARKMK
jgi:hypothetical protein